MPCYTVQRSTVDLGAVAKNPAFLEAALQRIGTNVKSYGSNLYTATIDGVEVSISNGKVQMKKGQEGTIASRITKACGLQAAKASAHKNGWSFSETGATTFVMKKRSL